jgi:HTH-type transcriptional regulator / antitoxin HipB
MRTKKEAFQVVSPTSLGLALRHFRVQAQVSQVDLAERAGLHRSYLSALESGHKTEYLQRVFQLMKQLGVKMTLEKTD